MTRIMITGANGFLGRHLARELSKSKDNSLMALSHSSQTSFLQKLGFQVLLRSEPQDVLRSKIETFAPEVVFHLAAIASAEL